MANDRKPMTIDDVDMNDGQAFDEFTRMSSQKVIKRLHAQVQEAIRLGIIDEKGNLLKHDLPEDMREEAERDFG